MPANIVIRIGAQSADAVREIDKVNKALGDQQTTAQKAHGAITKAAVPAAIALGAIAVAGVDAAKAAAEDQAAQEKLAGTLSRVTDATDAQLASVEPWISSLSRATGVADDELRPALGRLATATGDVGEAQKALQVALDVSAQTGKSLDSVSAAIAKGYAGQTTALNRLVPGLDQATIKSKDMHAIMTELSDLTGGAAAEHAATAAGQYEDLQVQMGELQETIGAGLLPVFRALLPVLLQATDFVSKHTDAVVAIIAVIGTLSGAIVAINGVLKAYQAVQVLVRAATIAWTAAQWLLNAALDANPIGLVIFAVAALAAGIVIAYNRSETFRNIVTAAFDAVKAAVSALDSAFDALLSAATAAFNWIVNHWKLALFAFGPIGAAVAVIADHFDALKSAAETAFSAITSGIGAVVSAIRSAIGWVDSLISKIHSIPHGVGGLIDKINPFMLPAGAPAASSTRAARDSSSASGITVNVYGAVDPEGTARAINRVLRAHNRRLGLAL